MTRKQDPEDLAAKGSPPRKRFTRSDRQYYGRFFDAMLNCQNEQFSISKEEMKTKILDYVSNRIDSDLINLQPDQGLGVVFLLEPIYKDKCPIDGPDARNTDLALEWTMAVFSRDKFTCQNCGKKTGVQAHHIKPWSQFPEYRFDIENGITLCRACHAEKHPDKKNLIMSDGRRHRGITK